MKFTEIINLRPAMSISKQNCFLADVILLLFDAVSVKPVNCMISLVEVEYLFVRILG